jgi:predicted NUDIX family phosphoesterase/thymidylate kinase
MRKPLWVPQEELSTMNSESGDFHQTKEQKLKEQLTALANRLRGNLDELEKPLIIEFAGTPKSGKTSCISAIAKFLRRNEIPVKVVTERASTCPIGNKHHLFFNTWTGAQSLCQMIEALDAHRFNVVILDRGLFDTLVWINFLHARKAASLEELQASERYFLLDRWSGRVDIVVALSVNPADALQREFKDDITDIPGSVMNLETLNSYNDNLRSAMEKYKTSFRRIIHLDTSNTQTVEAVAETAFEVLTAADHLVDEQVAVVDRQFLVDSFQQKPIVTEPEQVTEFTHQIVGNMRWMRRTEAELNKGLVQIVPVAVITRNGEILVLTIRGTSNGKRLVGKRSIWVGGHFRASDSQLDGSENGLRHCLIRELDEELSIRLDFADLSDVPNAVIWDSTAPRTEQHLALVFQYRIQAQKMQRNVLHQRELWESRTKSLFTEFVSVKGARLENMESWSKLYLRSFYDKDDSRNKRQPQFRQDVML